VRGRGAHAGPALHSEPGGPAVVRCAGLSYESRAGLAALIRWMVVEVEVEVVWWCVWGTCLPPKEER
jgi:hypothetical protein